MGGRHTPRTLEHPWKASNLRTNLAKTSGLFAYQGCQ